MRKKAIAVLTVILIATLSSLYEATAQPIPIGGTTQTNPFESNPTTSITSPPVLAGQTGTSSMTRDGDLISFLGWRIGGTATPPVPYLELRDFENLGTFTIGWVDIKIKYSVPLQTRDDRYRIIYKVGASSWYDLQPWISGSGSRFDFNGQADERVWSKVVEPTDGVWDWTDIASLTIRVETQRMAGIEDSMANKINVYEVWLSIYEGSYPPAGPGVSIQPSLILGIYAYDVFFVDVFVTDVVNMFAFEFMITYDTNVLTAIDHFTYHPFSTAILYEMNDDPWGNGTGYAHLAYTSYMGDTTGFTGSEPIARIYFTVDIEGSSALHFAQGYRFLYDAFGVPITAAYWQDGFFTTSEFHDVAVTGISVNATQVMPGQTVKINVDVSNQGTFAETGFVTVWHNSTPWSSEGFNVDVGSTQTVTFNWHTEAAIFGHYQIMAIATLVSDQDPNDNTLIDGVVIVGRHDIAVSNVMRAYPTISDGIPPSEMLPVERRQIVFINVTVQNVGTFSETFNLSACYSGGGIEQPRINGEYTVATLSGITLDLGASRTLSVAWNTSTVIYPGTQNWTLCSIIGRVTGIPLEKGVDYDNTLNNFFLDGIVNVTRSAIIHDVAVANVQASPVKAAPGDTVTITVRVENQGDVDETFTVTAYYNETTVGSQTITLALQGVITLNFAWNTTGLPQGDYPIKANASLVPGEADISDNERVDGVVTLAHRTLSAELSGDFDYAYRENIKIKVAALIKDASTLEPVSNAAVNIMIYNDAGALWVTATMVENPAGSGIYIWQSSGTIYSLGLAKGIYLVRVQASYKSGPTAHSMLLLHVDPPAEEPRDYTTYVALTIVALVCAAELILRRRQIFSRFPAKKPWYTLSQKVA